MPGTTAFPDGLDNFAGESPANLGDPDTTGRNHAERHDDVESAVEALMTRAGMTVTNFSEESPTYLGTADATSRTHSQRHNAIETALESIQSALGLTTTVFAKVSPTNLADDDATGRAHSERHDAYDAAIEAYEAFIGATATDTAPALLESATFYIDAEYHEGSQKVFNRGTGGQALNATCGSVAAGGVNVQPSLGLIYLPGVSGNYLSTPDAAALDITGDIDIRVRVALDDWTPAAETALLTKWDQAGGGPGFSYGLRLNAAGTLAFLYSAGAGAVVRTSTAATGVADGTVKWVRATFDVDNGAAGNDVKFWLSDDGSSWTQLGSTVTNAGVASIQNTTTSVVVGSYVGTPGYPAAGKFYRAQVYNGIAGSLVLDIDCADASRTSSTFLADTGQTVTINSTGADSNDPTFLAYDGTPYVYLPGVASNYLSTPDAAALDITGDIDIRVRVALDDWTPAADCVLLSKMQTSSTRSYMLYLTTTGTLYLYWTTGGSSLIARQSTVATGITDGAAKWVRATLDVDNGAAGHDVKFWLSDDGSTWTQLGATVTTAGTTSIYSGTSQVEVGSWTGGANTAAGKFYRAIVKSGIDGTTVLDIDTSVLTTGAATSFTATTGQTVTINRSTSGRKSVAVVAPCWLLGTDDYIEVADSDLLDFGASDSFTVLAVVRQWATPTSSGRYAYKRSAPGAGWGIASSGTSLAGAFVISDGSNTVGPAGATFTAGSLAALAGVFNRSGNTVTPYLNGTASTSTSISAVGDAGNSVALRVGYGSGAGPGNYQDFELVAVAVFRRALSASEVSAISTYYAARVP